MIRYEFGNAPESERAEVRKSIEHIAALAPVTHDVTVQYPIDLPKVYEKNRLIQFVEAQTNPDTNTIQISQQTFHTSELAPIDPRVINMPMAKKLPAIQFTAAHEWGHIITIPQYDTLVTRFRSDASMMLYLAFYNDMSTYGRSEFGESLAEAFAEWYLSEGQTRNISARYIATMAGWRTDFTK